MQPPKEQKPNPVGSGKEERKVTEREPPPPNPAQDHPKTRGGRWAAGRHPQAWGGVRTENRAPTQAPSVSTEVWEGCEELRSPQLGTIPLGRE